MNLSPLEKLYRFLRVHFVKVKDIWTTNLVDVDFQEFTQMIRKVGYQLSINQKEELRRLICDDGKRVHLMKLMRLDVWKKSQIQILSLITQKSCNLVKNKKREVSQKVSRNQGVYYSVSGGFRQAGKTASCIARGEELNNQTSKPSAIEASNLSVAYPRRPYSSNLMIARTEVEFYKSAYENHPRLLKSHQPFSSETQQNKLLSDKINRNNSQEKFELLVRIGEANNIMRSMKGTKRFEIRQEGAGLGIQEVDQDSQQRVQISQNDFNRKYKQIQRAQKQNTSEHRWLIGRDSHSISTKTNFKGTLLMVLEEKDEVTKDKLNERIKQRDKQLKTILLETARLKLILKDQLEVLEKNNINAKKE